MQKREIKLGKKGGAKRIAKELTDIRKASISKDVFKIVENACSR
jgi:hypothetical protein